MSAEKQEVQFEYGFALRGERQVERGLDSIMERFIKTGSVAEAAAVAAEKFGRVFEVGIPVALGVAAIGMVGEKIYEIGEDAVKTREKINKLTEGDLRIMDTGELESSLAQIGEEMEELGAEHGKKYGQSFVEAMATGLGKIGYNFDAFISNELPGGAGLMNFISGLRGQPGMWSNNMPSFDDLYNKPQLSGNARNRLTALHDLDQEKLDRLQRRETVAGQLERLDQTTAKGKLTAAELNLGVTNENVADDKTKLRKVQDESQAFQKSIADGHALTNEEIKKGVELEKRLNEANTQLLQDKIEQHNANKTINDLTRDLAKFRPEGIISTSQHKLGGGGRVYYHSLGVGSARLGGLGTNRLSQGAEPGIDKTPAMRATNYLHDFSDALRKGTEAIQTATGGSLKQTGI